MDAPPKVTETPTKEDNIKPTSKIENISKTINIIVGEKNFKIDFLNKIEYLLIVAKRHDNLFPIEYSGKFYLNDIKKIGLFRDYESIDECLFEIFEGLNSKINCFEKDNLNLIISVPLHTKKYPEISFTLEMNKKSDSEKYNELYEAVLNMKKQRDEEIKELKDKEIKLLKEKIENFRKIITN